MRFRRPPALVAKYYAYEATVTHGFFWPVFTIFLLHRGLSFTEIALLNSFSAGLVVVGEVPTGFVADRIGRRNSLLASSLAFAASMVGLAVARTFWQFGLVWVVWALAQTLRSGSGEAWLYDALQSRFDESEYTRVRGRAGAVSMTVSAASMLTAGALYELHPTVPFFAAAAINGLGVVVVLTLPRAMPDGGGGDDADPFTVFDALPVIRDRLTRPPLRSFVLAMALLFGVVAAADNYIQPVAVDALGYPETALGPVYAGFTVLSAAAGYFAGDLEAWLTRQRIVALAPLALGVVLVLPALAPLAAMPAFFVMKATRAAVAPVASAHVNDHVDSTGRATVASAVSMVYALARVPLEPASGVVADLTAPIPAVAALGGALAVGVLALRTWEPLVRAGHPGGAEASD